MVNNELRTKWRGRIARYAPLFLWIGVIFVFSGSTGSMSRTSWLIRPLLEFLFPGAPEETLLAYHFYIRKFAHFAEYAVLAFWTVRALSNSSIEILRKHKYLISIGMVLTISAIDETNQAFLSSRTGSIWDVLLDASGGLVMILLLCMLKAGQNRPRKRMVEL